MKILNSTDLDCPIKFTEKIINNYQINIKQGLNEYKLTNRLPVEPTYSIYCETTDPYLLNYYLVNKTEPAYDKFKTYSSDLTILNKTFIYDADQNVFLMFSFKVQLDYISFNNSFNINKVYDKPGYYALAIKYIDPANNRLNIIDLNVTSSNCFIIIFINF